MDISLVPENVIVFCQEMWFFYDGLTTPTGGKWLDPEEKCGLSKIAAAEPGEKERTEKNSFPIDGISRC